MHRHDSIPWYNVAAGTQPCCDIFQVEEGVAEGEEHSSCSRAISRIIQTTLLTFYWLELSHMATLDCKLGGWEMFSFHTTMNLPPNQESDTEAQRTYFQGLQV